MAAVSFVSRDLDLEAVRELDLPAAREAWGNAIEEAGAGDAVRAASDRSLGWWSRAAAACGLLDAEALDPAHGADVFEALVFGLLAFRDDDGARTAAVALVACSEDASAAIARVEAWRALCGIPRAAFWTMVDAADVPLADEVELRAWMGPVSGAGRAGMHVRLAPRSGGELCTIVSMELGIVEGVEREYGVRLCSRDMADAMADEVVRMGAIEVPGAEAAALVGEAMGAADQGTPGTKLLEPFAGRLPRIGRGPVPSAAEARAIVESVHHLPTWRFDGADLRGRDPDGPSERLARAVDRPAVRERSVAMARLAAYWHHWRGEPDTARSLAALAADAERHWRGSRLMRALLESSRTFVRLRASAAPRAPEELRLARIGEADLEAYGDGLIGAFAAAPEGLLRRAEGSSLAWVRVALMYSVGVHHVTPLAWSPAALADLLLGTMVYQATATGRDAAELLGDLRAFVQFLGRQWGLVGAEELLGVLGPWMEPVLAQALDDRSAWMPHKAALVAAREAGLLKDPEAFLARIQAERAGPVIAEA